MKRLTLDLNSYLEEANGEVTLLAYFIKLALKDCHGIPMVINYKNISWQPFEVEFGDFTWSINPDKFTMDICYEHET